VHLRSRLFGDVTAVIIALVLFVVIVAAVVVVVVVAGCGRSSRGRLHGPLQYVLFESRDGSHRRRRYAVGSVAVVDVRDGCCNVADDVERDVNGFAAASAVVVVAVLAVLHLSGSDRFRRGGSGAVPPSVRRQVGRTLKHLVALGTRVPDVHDAPTPVAGQRESVDVPDAAQPATVRAQRVRDALDLATSLVGGNDHVELGVDVTAVVIVVGVLCRGAVGHRRRVRRR